ncbi:MULTISPECIES: c-type cytochrome [Myroides]|uniref:C-type cytochrome n=1 Tax=Myroides albus TaxID=2562892 RepID=A0A6I3LF67_9FLAO|nr:MULTISPECIES: cytochrome c3 family protein [Myroides]MTG96853.1 c-type cytochrome [Myroides albus]MVX36958.1 c-type cytochrome [Myroides sp. LoEW2-1]UVD78397.1 c-type cytochrome [Myroides albus]
MKKVGNHNSFSKILFFCLALMLSFTTISFAQDAAKGKELFNSKCAACHKLDAKSTGPALRGVVERHDGDVEWLHKWIKSSSSLIKSGDATAVKLFEEWNSVPMNDFPELSDEDIDNILAYTSEEKAAAPVVTDSGASSQGGASKADAVSNIVVLGALVVVLLMLVTMLFSVRKVLKKVIETNGFEHEIIQRTSIWKAFVKNQFLVIVSVIVMVLVGSYFAFGYMMQIGVDKGYEPVQPIHFSHKIHAGDNGIDCKYCHSAARSSKTSGIPSLNVCMNCHKNISEFTGEAGKDYGKYTPEFYTGEIQKLYDAVGWDADAQKYTGKEKPVKWVRIHNLPDFAYYNHSQHVNVAGLECQTCHGPVEEMEIMRQHSPLTMGWCIDCHRKTDVKLENNEYYAKIHKELAGKYNKEKLTVADMGGLECGKCHY